MKKFLLASTFLTAFAPVQVQADPISIALAAASTFSSGWVVGMGVTTWQMGAFMSAFLPRLALGYALNALTPKPSLSGVEGYNVNTLGSAQPTAVIYGTVKVGGVIFYQETTNDNKYLHSLIALAGHQVQQIEKVYLNDEELTLTTSSNDSNGLPIYEVSSPTKYAGKVRIKLHLGEDNQASDATLASESSQWGVDHKASGIAYIYTRFEFDADAFPNGVPQVTALVQGKKVIQTGSSTGTYSSNSARCLADYLVYSGITTYDEIDSSLFTTATSVCDENVTLAGGGTEKKYECNGSFTTDLAPKEIVSNMLGSMGGMLWYSQGKWKMKAAKFTNPVLTLDENDLRSTLSIQTRNSRRDGFNKVEGTFKGLESNWQTTNYPAVSSTTFLGIDNNQENTIELNFPFTSSASMAQRIAKIALFRNREQISISGVFGLRALQLTVGDIVRLKNERLGFKDPDDASLGKLFEIVDWSFGLNSEMSLQCNMVLQEISSGIFDWDADETAFETNNTTLPSPFFVPDIGITLSQDLRIVNEHVVNVLSVTTTASANETSQVDKVEVEYKEQSESNFKSLGTGKLGLFEILDLEASTTGTTYNVRARAINSLGVKGTYATTSVVFLPEATPPANVTNFSFSISSGTLFLKWTAVADLDLSYYQVKHNSLTSGATWDNSSFDPIGIEKIARPATSAALPALSGTYLIKAYDKTGNESVTATSFVITASQLPSLGTSTTLTENPSFSGSKNNTGIDYVSDPDELRLFSMNANATGTYEFSSYIDLTTVRTATVSSEVVFTRVQINSGSWDNIPQNWDTWPENFDDWTDTDVGFNDNFVLVEVSATNDNPNSGSPTWGSYTAANGSQVVGRGFRFRATLSNTNQFVTPSISVLKGTVGY